MIDIILQVKEGRVCLPKQEGIKEDSYVVESETVHDGSEAIRRGCRFIEGVINIRYSTFGLNTPVSEMHVFRKRVKSEEAWTILCNMLAPEEA